MRVESGCHTPYDLAMVIELTEIEARVLGCLVEKERTTPDTYPLSTNALAVACNQKTSRRPVMTVSETEVDAAMLSLREKGLARSLRPTGSRTWKHRHIVPEALPIDDAELAVLAVLMLRGPQTAGELRTRTERIFEFAEMSEIERTLALLASKEPPLATNVGKGPGQSQDRWEHAIPIAGSVIRAPSVGASGRGDEFRALHRSGLFVMPNPWDVGSALRLQSHGFPALATTSAGHARSIGKRDQELTREELVRHVAQLTAVLEVPLHVDGERLYPDDPGGIAETVRLLAEVGASGCSIEDYDPHSATIDDTERATEAVAVAAEACRRHGLVLTARCENHLYGVDDLDDTVGRLRRYVESGAEVVYAPGLRSATDIELVVAELDVPVNVLARVDGPSVPTLEAIGVRRVSVGGALFDSVHRLLDDAAVELLGPGTTGFARVDRPGRHR